MNTFSFGVAIENLKYAKKVRRLYWKEDEFIFLVPGSIFQVNRKPLLGIYPEGTEITYHSHIDIVKDGVVMPWTPNQDDMLKEDWVLVD